MIYLGGAFCLAPGCTGKRILIEGRGGVARGDKRKVKMVIQDHNSTFLGSRQFLPGALEFYCSFKTLWLSQQISASRHSETP